MTKGIGPALESVFFTFATSSAEKIQARTWMRTAMSCRDAHWGGGGGGGCRSIEFLTYKMANFLGVTMRTGSKAKQMTKQAKAAKLQAPNTSSRSHLLTASACQSKSYHIEK